MNDLTIFNFRGYRVRTIVDKKGEPWWIAKDVCDVLGLENPTRALSGLEDDEKSTLQIGKGGPERNIINESGLYSLILRSRKLEAKAFKRWVTHEVLPSIRKDGSYSLKSDPKRLIAQALIEAHKIIENQKQKVEAYNHFINAENYQPWNVVAKALGTGRKRLLEFLRRQKILMSNNTPYQQYIDRGYFVVKEKPIEMGDVFRNYPQTFVTSKGVDFISKLWREAYKLKLVIGGKSS